MERTAQGVNVEQQTVILQNGDHVLLTDQQVLLLAAPLLQRLAKAGEWYQAPATDWAGM